MAKISKISPDGGSTKYELKDLQAHLLLDCTTARNVANKVVTCSGFELYKGCHVFVRFTDTGTNNPASGNLTLNINNTGAKTIVIGNSNKTVMTYAYAGEFFANKCHLFVYDGTNWVFIGRDTNTINSAGGKNKVGTKMFIVGVPSQNDVTSYSNANCYIGTDNRIYSNGKKCLIEGEGGSIRGTTPDTDNIMLVTDSEL